MRSSGCFWIHNLIEREENDAFYVFDCLSELQTAWATDLMMSNFFRVTCPFLFRMNTVAYFPLIRGMHSFQAIARIRDTAQVFLDVYPDGTGAGKPSAAEQAGTAGVYVRPEKVWNRYAETMLLPHYYNPVDGSFAPILDGVRASRFYQVMNRQQRSGTEQNTDAWDRFFNRAREKNAVGLDITEECSRMCNIMMSRDERLRKMIKTCFRPEDYFDIRDHMIGTGLIGGKATGMLLARRLIESMDPELASRLEPHDSFYIGSDVYYSYIVENDCWDLRVRQRTDQEYFSLAGTFADKLLTGEFPGELEEKFAYLLEYYGHDPIIVRSSSILEDGFGNAFAGKYESVFCANSGHLDERLEDFKRAIRTVYASTMSLSALEYRKQRGLDKRDEQMAILVQRVSGSHYGQYYMPCAAGVGYSCSPYRFLKDMDPSAGMLRLVMGLGISAVDRTEGSYPRLVNLDRPEETAAVTSQEKHQYSQRGIEVVNKEKKGIEQIDLRQIEDKLPLFLQKLLLEHDTEAERRLADRGQDRTIRYISCAGLVRRKDIMGDMRRMLHLIQQKYGCPVDTEFTINLSGQGDYVINLLQCRPLEVFQDTGAVQIPQNLRQESMLLKLVDASMGLSREEKLDFIVLIDPQGYYQLPYAEKTNIARAVSAFNWKHRGKGCHMLLMVPGRIGTSSPELGVPTTFADISAFDAICEIADSRAGYNPELSYGSHIFQDLVEAQILYMAVFENEHTRIWQPELLQKFPNMAKDYLGEENPPEKYENVIKIYDVREADCRLYHDMKTGTVVTAFLSGNAVR
ncbi:MAG: PEP/pyruvate-binding domain-containing protein [Bilifractor sp.]